MLLSPGTRLAQYEIVSPLGAGGMGEVYRARDSRLGRDVAIKVLSPQLAADPDMRDRFEREARAVAALSHPGILAIHEFAIVNGLSFAVMELIEGETLRAHLTRGRLPWRTSAELSAAIADGLAAAHAKGIVHRDLKPENIIITADGLVKIVDFGLARHAPVAVLAGTADSDPTILETMPGAVLGTLGYMAPEQVRGGTTDARTDIFAFGCLLYEMLAGRRAFQAGTPQEALAVVLRDEPPPIADVEGASRLEPIVRNCLQKDPARRFQSARDIAEALRAMLNESTGSRTAARRGNRGKSLAVFPFVNVGLDPGAEYLSDGVTESIINNLSQLPRLRVVPRSTVFRYKGRDVDVRAAGLALNVRTILMGRIAQRGDVLNIQAELVDAATESQLWGQQFNRRVEDIFAVQEEIAWQISEALRLKLTGDEKKRLAARPTQSTEAYDLYLKGRYHWNQWTPDGFRRAIEYFDQAIAVDPRYARAYAGKGDAYGAMAYYGYLHPSEGFPMSRAAALRAVELDSGLAESHVTLALGEMFHLWDWNAAERSFRRAIELDPKLALARSFYGLWLAARGRHEEAVAEARLAQKLDPQGLIINAGVGWSLYFARRFPDALVQAERLRDLYPDFLEGAVQLLGLHESTGRLREAAAALALPNCYFGGPEAGARAAAALEAEGAPGYWRVRIEALQERARRSYVPESFFALVHARAGNVDAALDWLEQAFVKRNGGMVFLDADPAFDALRHDARFQSVRERVGLI
jgi:serine/threonine protein kinase/tetratricopeptide (TPR) repeat protein